MSEQVTPTSAGPCSDGPCEEAKLHVWDYLDGEMGDGDCERIKAHLDECESCRTTFANEQKMKDVVSRACGCDAAPQDLKSRIVAMVEKLRNESCRSSDTK